MIEEMEQRKGSDIEEGTLDWESKRVAGQP